MLLSKTDPLLNTIIVFVLIMASIYIAKPRLLYDYDNDEFKRFGTDNNRTLMPIYVIGLLLAMLLYIFFSKTMTNTVSLDVNTNTYTNTNNTHNTYDKNIYDKNIYDTPYPIYNRLDYGMNTLSHNNAMLLEQLRTQTLINKQIMNRLDGLENNINTKGMDSTILSLMDD